MSSVFFRILMTSPISIQTSLISTAFFFFRGHSLDMDQIIQKASGISQWKIEVGIQFTKTSLLLGITLVMLEMVRTRSTSILGSRGVQSVTQQLLCSKSYDFLAVFALAHSKINQIAYFFLKLSKRFLTRLVVC